MIVELKGVEFENKGSYLMLLAIQSELYSRMPNVMFAIRASSVASPEQIRQVPALRKINLRKNIFDFNKLTYLIPSTMRRFLIKCGIVLESDVDMIMDASGFSYSDQWSSNVRIYHLENELKRFNLTQKLYIFLPQAFGPFSDKDTCDRIRNSFRHAAMICARDKNSFEHLKKILGRPSNLHQFPDITVNLDGFINEAAEIYQDTACIIPNSIMLSSQNPCAHWHSSYEWTLVKAIECYQSLGLKPFFLNHSSQKDIALINKVNACITAPIPVLDEANPLVVKGIIGAAAAVFSSRYHGCLSALSQGKACVGTAWSHKYEALYSEYNAKEFLISSPLNVEKLQRLIAKSCVSQKSATGQIMLCSKRDRKRCLKMWDDISILVKSNIEISKSVKQ